MRILTLGRAQTYTPRMPEATNFRMTIQYDGRPFSGWQRQKNGVTIQGCLEEAIAKVFDFKCSVHGAGRTDAGVHALGQVATVRIHTAMAPARLARALNADLPREIRITSARRVPRNFHARVMAKEKQYRYLLITGYRKSPFAPFYACWTPFRLSIDRMKQGIKHLVGRHDFASFMASGSSVKSTVREIKEFRLKHGGGMISFLIVADGFLRHMVRIIVGTLIEIGRGKLHPDEVERIIKLRDRRRAGPTAPPEGLTLMKVIY